MYNEHIKFRKEIANIATSLINALDTLPELDDFVIVSSGKLKSQSSDIASDRCVSGIASTTVSYSRTVSGPHANSIHQQRGPGPTTEDAHPAAGPTTPAPAPAPEKSQN